MFCHPHQLANNIYPVQPHKKELIELSLVQQNIYFYVTMFSPGLA